MDGTFSTSCVVSCTCCLYTCNISNMSLASLVVNRLLLALLRHACIILSQRRITFLLLGITIVPLLQLAVLSICLLTSSIYLRHVLLFTTILLWRCSAILTICFVIWRTVRCCSPWRSICCVQLLSSSNMSFFAVYTSGMWNNNAYYDHGAAAPKWSSLIHTHLTAVPTLLLCCDGTSVACLCCIYCRLLYNVGRCNLT